MDKLTFEIISDRPIKINLKSLKAQGALMMAQMGGYIDKSSIKYDPKAGTLSLTVKEKGLQIIEERLK